MGSTGSKAIDITKLRESGKAMHQSTLETTRLLQGVRPQDIPNSKEIVTLLEPQIQDAIQVLQIGKQLGVPGIPAGIPATTGLSTSR